MVQSNFAIFCADSLDIEIEQLGKHINEYVKKMNLQESEINSLINEPSEYYSINPMNKSIEEKINEIEILLETTNTSILSYTQSQKCFSLRNI